VPIDLIIFDCDGVLVDSEVISCRAHADVLSRHGYQITSDEVFERFLGRSTRQANLEIEAELGRKLPDGYRGQRRRNYRRAGGRNDRARLLRRQPLSSRLCRGPAPGGSRPDVWRYAAITRTGPPGGCGRLGGLMPTTIVIPRHRDSSNTESRFWDEIPGRMLGPRLARPVASPRNDGLGGSNRWIFTASAYI